MGDDWFVAEHIDHDAPGLRREVKWCFQVYRARPWEISLDLR
jgi:hypothetical protein